MESLFHIRVVTKTGVGSLARMLRAIEQIDGRIASVDLQSGSSEVGIADMFVRLDEANADLDTISDALRTHQGGVVSEFSRADDVVDPVLRAIRWASSLVGAGKLSNDEFKRIMSEVCSTPDAWYLTLEEADRVDVSAEAMKKWAPVSQTVSVVPDNLQVSFTGPAVILAVPDARLEPTGVALVVRPATQLFSTTEIDRVEAILALRRRSVLLNTTVEAVDDGYWFDISSL